MRRLMLVLMAGALMLINVACGGSSDDDGVDAASDATTTTAESSSDDDADDDSDSDAIASSGIFSGDCREAVEAYTEAYGSLGQASAAAMTGDTSVDLTRAGEAIERLAENAPDALKDDFEVLADELVPFYRGLAEIDFDEGKQPTEAQIAKLQELTEDIDQAALQTANQHIDEYFRSECKTG